MITTDNNIGYELRKINMFVVYCRLVLNQLDFEDEELEQIVGRITELFSSCINVHLSTLIYHFKLKPLVKYQDSYFYGFDNFYFSFDKSEELMKDLDCEPSEISKEDRIAIAKINRDDEFIGDYQQRIVEENDNQAVFDEILKQMSRLNLEVIKDYMIKIGKASAEYLECVHLTIMTINGFLEYFNNQKG